MIQDRSFKHAVKTDMFILSSALLASNAYAQTITINELSFTPTIDGSAAEWQSVHSSSVPLSKTRADGKSDIATVTVKAGTSGNQVCFLLQ